MAKIEASIQLRSVLLIFCLFATSVNASPQQVLTAKLTTKDIKVDSFQGIAFALNAEEGEETILYSEHHNIVRNLAGDYLKSMVEYRSAEGELIGTKELRFSDYPTLPELRFEDYRMRQYLETRNDLNTQKNVVDLTSGYDSLVDSSKVEIENLERAVVDAGFDLLVLKYWDKLLNDQKVEFDFLALTRASFYRFALKKEMIKESEVIFSLRPSSFLLGLIVDPIRLTYDVNSKRLMRFEGITNIEKVLNGMPTGNNYIARIEYQYEKDSNRKN